MEVVSSASPFGCVLKDHNLRRPPIPQTTNTTTSKCKPNLQKTLKELVREHLRSSISSISNSDENSNSFQSSDASRPIQHHRRPAHQTKVMNERQEEDHKAAFSREPSPALSDSSSVSCLVQKWSELETSDPKQLPIPTTSNHQTQNPIQHSGFVPPSRTSSLGSNNDSISDWESDQAPIIGASEKAADERKKEKSRVAGIIRKLPLKLHPGVAESGEGAVHSPCIRGRQAVEDLFARLARDRNQEIKAIAERHAVSNFPKRGRIQSLMKVRLMRHQASTDNNRHHQEPRVQEASKPTRWFNSVNSLKRFFSSVAAGQNDSDNTASTENETSSNNLASTSNQPSEARKDNCQKEISLRQINVETPKTYHQECVQQLSTTATTETTDNEQDEVELYNQQTEEQENWETASSSASTEVAMQVEIEDPPLKLPSSNGSEEEVNYYESPGRTNTLSRDIWEEEMGEDEEYYDNDFFEPNLDWIHDISRPRSYWESRRQEWYQEICESSTNNDIRQLIERRSVSAVLESDFRDRMDHLLISNVQLQMHPIDSLGDEEDQPMVNSGSVSAVLASDFRDRMDQLMRFRVQQQMHSIDSREQEHHGHPNVDEQLVIHGQDSREVEPIEEAIRDNVDENEDIEEENEEQKLSYYHREQTPLSELPWSSYQDQEYNDDHENRKAEPKQEEAIRKEGVDGDEDIEEGDGEQNLSYYREQTPLSELPWSSYQDQEDTDDHESRKVEPKQEEARREESVGGDEDEDIEAGDEEHNLSYYREQTPPLEQPWSTYQDQEDSDDLEQIESETRRHRSFLTNYDHDSQIGSSNRNRSIIEVELICDIREHLQQIYREMSEMRKAVNSCMDMQSKFQGSIKEEVTAAISQLHSETIGGKELKRETPKKGSCRICHKNKADTLLYRCGHMCTCFECAHELQWSSGKCPICWAEIVDVVRVCTD